MDIEYFFLLQAKKKKGHVKNREREKENVI